MLEKHASVAQLVERILAMDEVTGSKPARCSKVRDVICLILMYANTVINLLAGSVHGRFMKTHVY